jgi:3-keto-disaccharide hydrolase
VRRFLAFLAITLIISLPLLVARAADNSPTDESGFVSIFNGKDLTGWKYGLWDRELNKVGKGYAVKDGVIYCTPNDSGDLYTEKEYSDFILRFEFKLTLNANNGIGIRSPAQGDSAYVGMEIQVLDDSGSWYTNLHPWQYHGSIYDVVPAKRGHLKPVGEWNSEEISAIGPHIKVTLNGAVIVDANLDAIKDPNVLRFHSGLKRKSGHIGFLGHQSRVDFRNLRIKDLSQ